MNENFEQTINRIAQNSTILLEKGEEATKQLVILPILAHLEWNIHDINEVEPEYKVSDGRVDYCLKINNKKIFLEAKRMREELENHEKQLLEYSFQEGVEIAILTNGLVWWFYLPLEKGHWQQRKFFTIDFNQQNSSTIMKHFNKFFNKDGIVDGSCINNAHAIKQGKEKNTALVKAIPEAWEKLLSGNEETFIDIFAEKVENLCGHRPEPDVLIDFMQSFLCRPAEKPLSRQQNPSQKIKPTMSNISVISSNIKIQIDNKFFEAPSVQKLYDEVLKYLCDTGLIKQMHIPFETSAKRYLIATEPYHQRGNGFRLSVEYSGYYMEAHKSRRAALDHLSYFIKSNGMNYTISRY
jgi:hypothetical protein